MNQELIDEIKAIAEREQAGGNTAVAGIMLSLAGSIAMGAEVEMFKHVSDFSRKQLEIIRSYRVGLN